MSESFRHLIFFDGQCGLCQKAVKHIIAIDRDKIFCFAPLSGDTASTILTGKFSYLQKENSLVLIESFQTFHKRFWLRSKGAFRIYWLLGGKWKFLGALHFLPSFLINPLYRFIAKHRHQFGAKQNNELFEGKEKSRFLP
ncbi:MAG: DCC1-like thiol-disulfide oxidoreductase family protein [Chlamydiota bacterium]|jgi:predicted DCC family thiol-disulfide oxidoreductase YuxK